MKILAKTFKITLIAILIVALFALAGFFGLKMLFPANYKPEILKAAEKYDVDPYLIFAVIKAESNFVTDAKSNKNAVGLMQITEATAIWIAENLEYENFTAKQLQDPKTSIEFGTWYLRYLLDTYNGNEVLALCAYNAGLGNVDKWLSNKAYSNDGKYIEKIPFSETEKYINKIDRFKKWYKFLYPDVKK